MEAESLRCVLEASNNGDDNNNAASERAHVYEGEEEEGEEGKGKGGTDMAAVCWTAVVPLVQPVVLLLLGGS